MSQLCNQGKKGIGYLEERKTDCEHLRKCAARGCDRVAAVNELGLCWFCYNVTVKKRLK